jgi:ribosomal protein S18 acetylase RimI-like enzyme
MMAIRLTPMTPSEFDEYVESSIRGYANDNILAGRWTPEKAVESAREEFKRLLPKGLETAGHHVFDVVTDPGGVKVGVVWLSLSLGPPPRTAFIYDLRILPQHQRKGLGTAAMAAAEELARSQGFGRIGLNVFGHNPDARRLYASRGYRTVAEMMTKPLTPEQ